LARFWQLGLSAHEMTFVFEGLHFDQLKADESQGSFELIVEGGKLFQRFVNFSGMLLVSPGQLIPQFYFFLWAWSFPSSFFIDLAKPHCDMSCRCDVSHPGSKTSNQPRPCP
jgi:hypothetical protein